MEKSINNLLDFISAATDIEFLESVYENTSNALEKLNNDRLFTKINLKLAKIYLDRKQFDSFTKASHLYVYI
jgi:COP9 signalosome complex subunit 2